MGLKRNIYQGLPDQILYVPAWPNTQVTFQAQIEVPLPLWTHFKKDRVRTQKYD